MDNFSGLIDAQLILLVGAIATVVLVSRLAFRLFSQESKTLLALVTVLLVLEFIFGISPREVWFEISHLPQAIARLTQPLA
ncbi:MAG: hypothetical protein F6K00_21430 [Leptolyngbya sp. SIOISBB]|nr:hypothetical protein [Leptolyngbya sp. SIOISBB]